MHEQILPNDEPPTHDETPSPVELPPRRPHPPQPLEHSLAPRGPHAPPPDPLAWDALHQRFHIERPLGRGGWGTVHLAHDRTHGTRVALKRLHDPHHGAVQRFLHEASAIAALDHPHIVRLLDVLHLDQEVALVLEFIDGPDLDTETKRRGPWALDDALRLTQHLADALAHAHQRGVVHRDVKPHNVLLGPDDHPRLTDFGLAAVSDLQSLTPSHGGPLGTLDYMAPELRTTRARLDPRLDVYSLGATLYHLLTGRPPRVIQERRIPEPARDLVLQCVEEDPRDRLPDAASLRDALERLRVKLRHESAGSARLTAVARDLDRRASTLAANDRTRRLHLAATGLAALDLLPPDAPAQLLARAELGEDLPTSLAWILAHTRHLAPSPSALANAHAILLATLAPVLDPPSRTQLDKLAHHSRQPPKP